MKGVFGILLVGGGIILMVGLFTGKISFPLGSPGSSAASSGSAPSGGTPKKPVPGKPGQAGTAGIPPIVNQPGPCPPGASKC